MDIKDHQAYEKVASIELDGGTGEITKMCATGDFTEIYKIDKTFRLQTPESLDPENKDPNMPFVVNSTEKAGSGNPIVARVFIQIYDALKNVTFKEAINFSEILSYAHTCKELLLGCELEYIEFMDKFNVGVTQIENGKITKTQNAYPSFPTIDNLEHLTASFLSNAKRVIETAAKIFNSFYKTSFDGPRFDVIQKWLEKNKPEEKDFIRHIEKSNKLLKQITDMRNHQEHPQAHIKLNVNDFKLLPHNQVALPSWGLTDNELTNIHLDMPNFIKFLVGFLETHVFHCILVNLDSTEHYIIREFQETERNYKCPIRYSIEIDNPSK